MKDGEGRVKKEKENDFGQKKSLDVDDKVVLRRGSGERRCTHTHTHTHTHTNTQIEGCV